MEAWEGATEGTQASAIGQEAQHARGSLGSTASSRRRGAGSGIPLNPSVALTSVWGYQHWGRRPDAGRTAVQRPEATRPREGTPSPFRTRAALSLDGCGGCGKGTTPASSEDSTRHDAAPPATHTHSPPDLQRPRLLFLLLDEPLVRWASSMRDCSPGPGADLLPETAAPSAAIATVPTPTSPPRAPLPPSFASFN